MKTRLLYHPGGGGGNSSPAPAPVGVANQDQVAAQAAAAEKQRLQQQQQWEAEQAQQSQASQANADLQSQQLEQAQQQQAQDAANFQKSNMAQGQAAGATGGPNGIKAAATVGGNTLSPIDAKLQAAGASLPGVDSLANLLKKRTLSQSNMVGSATGNSLQPASATLG